MSKQVAKMTQRTFEKGKHKRHCFIHYAMRVCLHFISDSYEDVNHMKDTEDSVFRIFAQRCQNVQTRNICFNQVTSRVVMRFITYQRKSVKTVSNYLYYTYIRHNYEKLCTNVYNTGFPFPPLTPGILRLYSMRFCPYAQRTRLVLAHKNIPYETINVHLRRKPDWLLARNPKGRVPVLEFSDGRIVFESVITCQYLDDIYPQEPLTPADPHQKARDRLFVDYCDKFMMAIYQLWSSDSNREKAKATIHVGMQMYEQELTQRNNGPFFGGNTPTMLDYLIWPWFERLSPFVNPEVMPHHALTKNRNTELTYQRATGALQYPRLQRWMSFMVKLPAVKTTMFDLHMHHNFGHSQIAGDPDYDVGLNDEPPFPHSQL